MDIELVTIEKELKKRLAYPYKWGRKQNDEFDKLTNFVNKTPSFAEVLKETEKRFGKDKKHLKNRLIIILYSSDGKHWKLKAEILWLKERIEKYMSGFNPHFLLKFQFEKNQSAISDVIWSTRQ